MIGPGTGVRVYLACGITDMRKGIEGLAALTQDLLRQKPTGGAVIAFRGHIHVAIDNNAPAIRAHDLDTTKIRSRALLRRFRRDHRRHKSGNAAKSSFTIRLAPGKQELVGNPVPTRRR